MSEREDPECVKARPCTPTHATCYVNRYGTTLIGCPSYQDALVVACRTIVEWWDEVEDADVRRTLRELFEVGAWEEALRVWNDYQSEVGSGEDLEIHALTFEAPRPFTMPPEEESE